MKTTIFWNMMPCSLLNDKHEFMHPDYRRIRFHWNITTHLTNYMASHITVILVYETNVTNFPT